MKANYHTQGELWLKNGIANTAYSRSYTVIHKLPALLSHRISTIYRTNAPHLVATLFYIHSMMIHRLTDSVIPSSEDIVPSRRVDLERGYLNTYLSFYQYSTPHPSRILGGDSIYISRRNYWRSVENSSMVDTTTTTLVNSAVLTTDISGRVLLSNTDLTSQKITQMTKGDAYSI